MRKETTEASMAAEAVRCAEAASSGSLLLFPSDTLWGLGCDASNREAVSRLAVLKKRPEEKSFICLVNSWRMLQNVVSEIPEMAGELLKVAGSPLTIVYPSSTSGFNHLCAGDGSIAVRMVERGFCAEVMKILRRPLLSTSANESGQKNPERFSEIPQAIKDGCGYIADPGPDYEMTGKASGIVRLWEDGRIAVLRK